jgi:hypothetical protein
MSFDTFRRLGTASTLVAVSVRKPGVAEYLRSTVPEGLGTAKDRLDLGVTASSYRPVSQVHSGPVLLPTQSQSNPKFQGSISNIQIRYIITVARLLASFTSIALSQFLVQVRIRVRFTNYIASSLKGQGTQPPA